MKDILQKPNKRGRKKRRLPRSYDSYRDQYNKIRDTVIRQGNWVVVDSLPEELREWFIRKRYIEQFRCRRNILAKRCTRLSWDKKIYLHKYYPWCYKNYVPQVVLQGWYDVKIAKKKYKKVYGKDALKYIKFIKGKLALERDFKVGRCIYVNGKWVRPFSKIMIPRDVKYIGRSTTPKAKAAEQMLFGYKSSKTSSKFKERALLRWQFYEQYGYKYKEDDFQHLTKEEKIKLQEIQSIIRGRKNYLYEEPS